MKDTVEDNSSNSLSAYTPSSDPRLDIKTPLERVVPYLIHDLVEANIYSWHPAIIVMFSHIDFLGYLYSGGLKSATSVNAVNFMREYFGKIDARYEKISGFLYHTLRHGLVHQGMAKRIKLKNGDTVDFVFAVSSTPKRVRHLSVSKKEEGVKFRFDIGLFYQDLMDAIEYYCSDILSSKKLRTGYENAWTALGVPEMEDKVKSHPYIESSDLDFVF